MRHWGLRRNAFVAAGSLLTTPAFSAGFGLEHQNAQALGAAFAGAEAVQSDAGFAAHNPASIVGVDRFEINLSVTGVWPKSRYENVQGTLLGAAPVAGFSEGKGVADKAVVPNLSLAVPISDRLAVGLVTNATFGFATGFGADSAIRYQARDSKVRAIEITPVAAISIAPGVKFGASLRFQSLDLSITSTIDAGGVAAASLIPGFAPGQSDLDAAFDGAGWAVGYALGVQADLSPRLRIGLSYASKIDHDIDGDARFDLASSVAAQTLNAVAGLFGADRFSTRFSTPASAAIGVRFDATDRLTLLASTKYTRWSIFETATFTFNDGATPPEVLTQNWRDSWSFSLGGEYAIDSATKLRGGVMYDETPVNSEFASPRIPDGDRYWFAAGFSRALGDSLSADLGVAYAFFSDRAIDLDGAAAENLFRGSLAADFKTEAYAVSLRMRYKF